MFTGLFFFAQTPFAAAETGTSHFDKALDLYNHKIYLGAVGELDAYIKANPGHIDSYILVARIYLDLKKYPEAADAVIAALDIDPNDQKVLDMAHKVLSAMPVREEEENAGPADDVAAFLKFARIYSRLKDYSNAVEYYREYLRGRLEDINAQIELADVYVWMGELNQASGELESVVDASPKNTRAHLKLGLVYEWQGKYRAAKAEYQKVIYQAGSKRENLPDADTFSGDTGDDTGPAYENQPAAGPWSAEDKEMVSDYAEAKKGLLRIKKLEDKAKEWETAAGLKSIIDNTQNYSLYLNLANLLYYNENKKEEAIKYYKLYLEKYRRDYKTKLQLARILSWEKLYPDACTLYLDYLDEYPGERSVRLELANVYAWENRYGEALAELDRIVEEDASMPEPYVLFGNIYEWQGDYGKALENYRQAASLSPSREDEMSDRIAQIEKRFRPDAYFRYSRVTTSFYDFSRTGYDIGCRLHFKDGRIALSPGYKKYWLRQQAVDVPANGMYLSGEGTVSEKIRWSSTVSYVGYKEYENDLNFDGAVYAVLSTSTRIVADYARHDITTEMDNLNALLAGKVIRLDDFGLSVVHQYSERGELDAGLSEAMLSDGNGREQLYGKFLYGISSSPLLKIGCGYKMLSFSQDSPGNYYWAPKSYSGVGFIGAWSYEYTGVLNCELNFGMYRILESLQVENNIDGRIDFVGSEPLTAGIAFSIGKGSSGGGSGSVYRGITAEIRYYF
jgi:tetratricopeptide (TPR) repeat protein